MLRPFQTFKVVPSLPEELSPLRKLVYNLWWTWNREAISLFSSLDRDLWDSTRHNPVRMLGEINQGRLEELARDEHFLEDMHRVCQHLDEYMAKEDTWFSLNVADEDPDLRVAYFSMEFGITECIPNYSGGLGVLSGEHLKSASDLGIPLVGVGLLYQNGYFHQYLNADGWQQESYPLNDFHTMPLHMEVDENGDPVTVTVHYPFGAVVAQVWRAQVGRVPLYLLNTNLEINPEEGREITGKLYGGHMDMRIRQEIMLGVGGVRALAALGIKPTVFHMNEGHSAFLGVERIRKAMQEQGLSFGAARELVTAGNIFTTHTPVPAGIDRFPPELIDKYFSQHYHRVNLTRQEALQLGRPPGAASNDCFSMAVLALRLAQRTNGVSERHGEIARQMWRHLWPGMLDEEVPITSITNGVHHLSWISSHMEDLFTRYLGTRWKKDPADPAAWEGVDAIPEGELWRTHERRRALLVKVAREHFVQQLAQRGVSLSRGFTPDDLLDPDVLTIGFARRFATYKRALLLFHDVERLVKIITNPERPVQIIFAGKAHPHDDPAKDYIRQIVHLARSDDLRRHVVFLEDYDISLARYLVQGSDIWLNTPRVGMEASGTSGMKAVLNGVLHVSTMDGWWVEGYAPENGWRIGQGETYDDADYGDRVEARALYDLLEEEIVPLFYEVGADAVPNGWVRKMKHAIRDIAPFFNTHRMVQDYVRDLYVPTKQQYGTLAADGAKKAQELATWREKVRENWQSVCIEAIECDIDGDVPASAEITVTAHLHLAPLTPSDVLVRVYHGNIGRQDNITEYETTVMTCQGEDEEGHYLYTASIPSGQSGMYGYTVRVVPQHETLAHNPLPGLTLWAR
ncbi:MAG: alpha-glucan family phosphorylase [Chloroflexota bacterium]|nr:alpha-glucan family phosphorylase [Chloroflexota bacterium]